MPLFGKSNHHQILGVDIGSTALKFVQLSREKDRWVVDQFAIEPLSEGLIVDGQIVDQEQIGACIRHAVREHKFKAKQAVACVNYADVISKVVQTNHFLSEREMEQWIEFEVDKFVPYPIDELSMDFYLSDNSSRDFEQDVLVIACRRQTVENIAACIDESGLEPIAVDVANNALGRALQQVLLGYAGAGMDALTAVVDYGVIATRFYVFSGEEMLFHHDIPVENGTLIHRFADAYGLPYQTAYTQFMKKRLPVDFKQKVLKPYVRQMVSDIERGIHYFESSGLVGTIGRILISGGAAQISGVTKAFTKKLGVEVLVMDVLSTLITRRKLDDQLIRKCAPQLAVACGLAMWEKHQ